MHVRVALAYLFLAAPAAAEEPLHVGATLRQGLALGSGTVRRVVPLPEGEWEVLRVREYDGRRTRPNDYSNPPRMIDVALVQRDGPRILMLMRVVTLREPTNVTRWTQPDPCDRTDTLHRNPYDSAAWERTCLLVDHTTGFLAGSRAADFADLRQWVAKEAVELPSTALHSVFARVAAHENFRVQVWANPALRNLDAAETRWAASPFHRDWLDKDPARRQYVADFVAWSEGYATRLRSPAGQGAAPIAPFR
jgi:hypothetical protein